VCEEIKKNESKKARKTPTHTQQELIHSTKDVRKENNNNNNNNNRFALPI
jgi:hypothetical protein